MSASRRRGFTIVELLVVVAILAILMGLALPAVNAARESGRRTACMSNLNQLGMAVVRFDQDRGAVPCWDNTLAGLKVSWPVVLLPFLERNDLYDLWSDSNSANNSIVQIAALMCPSSPPEASNFGPLAYAGNCGDGTSVVTASTDSKYNGVMPWSAVRYSLSDIADYDGTGTTLLFAEKCKNRYQASWGVNGFVGFSFQQNAAGSSVVQLPAFGISDVLPDYAPAPGHKGGVTVAFCDGHTRFISAGIDPPTYKQLVTSRNSRVTKTAYQAPPLDGSKY